VGGENLWKEGDGGWEKEGGRERGKEGEEGGSERSEEGERGKKELRKEGKGKIKIHIYMYPTLPKLVGSHNTTLSH